MELRSPNLGHFSEFKQCNLYVDLLPPFLVVNPPPEVGMSRKGQRDNTPIVQTPLKVLE